MPVSEMDFKRSRLVKLLVALYALVGLLSRVEAEVSGQITALCKRLVALGALERQFSRVGAEVVFQVGSHREGHGTFRALKGSIIGVRAHVNFPVIFKVSWQPIGHTWTWLMNKFYPDLAFR
jgi:hypothetical protein